MAIRVSFYVSLIFFSGLPVTRIGRNKYTNIHESIAATSDTVYISLVYTTLKDTNKNTTKVVYIRL